MAWRWDLAHLEMVYVWWAVARWIWQIWSRKRDQNDICSDRTEWMIFEHFPCTCCLFCQLFSEAHKPQWCVYVRECAHTHSPFVAPLRSVLTSCYLTQFCSFQLPSTFIHGMHARIHTGRRTNEQTNERTSKYTWHVCVCMCHTVRTILAPIHAHAQGNFHPFMYFLVCVAFECHTVLLSVWLQTHTHTHAPTKACVMSLPACSHCVRCSTRRFLFVVT